MTDNDGTQERAAQTMPGRDELRERVARLIEPYYWGEGLDALVEDNPASTPAIHRCDSLDSADAILAEIEQAGYVLVKADRWERVRNYARSCDYDCICVHGDLDGEAGA